MRCKYAKREEIGLVHRVQSRNGGETHEIAKERRHDPKMSLETRLSYAFEIDKTEVVT